MNAAMRAFSLRFSVGISLLLSIGRIVSRTGHSGWQALLVLVPGVNRLILIYVVFSDWPVERKGILSRHQRKVFAALTKIFLSSNLEIKNGILCAEHDAANLTRKIFRIAIDTIHNFSHMIR